MMGSKKKAMKFPFPFKSKQQSALVSSSSWSWPTCATPKTVSFRATNVEDDIFKTMNSAYVDGGAVDLAENHEGAAQVDPCDCISPCESERFSTVPEVFEVEEDEEKGDSVVETVIRGLRSERLFFEPGETSSILEEAKLDDFPFKESMVMAMDSRDPFVDFRRSMEEMVEAHGLKDWECLEDLLSCYLRVNGKSNHGYIVGAFVDLLVSLANADSPEASSSSFSSSNVEDRHQFPNCSVCSVTHSFTSPLSFFSTGTTTTTATNSASPSVSLVEVDDEIEKSSSGTMDNASSSSSNNIH